MSAANGQAAPPPPPPGRAREDVEARWREFSRLTVLVLAATSLATILCVGAVMAWSMGGLARREQQAKAEELAELMARLVFVPVSLGDRARLDRAVDDYLRDPDLHRVVVRDARGETLVSRLLPEAAIWTVEATRPVHPSREPRGPAAKARVGSVTIALNLSSKYGVVARTAAAMTALSALLLLAGVVASLSLIRQMTLRLRRLIEEAQLAEKYEVSNRELEQFAFVASHDLQEPLRKIISFCQLLDRSYRGRLDAEGDKLLDVIIAAGERMRALINDLLAYARVGSQGAPFRRTDSRAVVREVLDTLQEPVRASGAEVDCGRLPVVQADPLQLAQLFQNLIGNALKFRGDAPPRVRLQAAPSGKLWRFDVADNGIGIDPKHHDRVFEMFKRLHSRDKYPGTGVGLAVCKKIVERHGGTIWLDSAPGRGTVFHFTLRGGSS